MTSKAYRVYNKRTKLVEESIHVIFDESNDGSLSESFADLNLNKHESEDEEDPENGSKTILQENKRDFQSHKNGSQSLEIDSQGI